MRSLLLLFLITLNLYADDISDLRKAAATGDARAENALGVAYQWGQGVERDYTEAAKWFTAAAKQNYAAAQFNLGVMHLEGQAPGSNVTKAAAWFLLARENGDTSAADALRRMAKENPTFDERRAQTELARMFLVGEDVLPDAARGLKLLRAAAEQDARAQLLLCVALSRGQGVPPDPTEGHAWCERAAKSGDFEYSRAAKSFLARELLSEQNAAQSRARALSLLEEVATEGDRDAFYLLGSEETSDPVASSKWLLLGAVSNCEPCLKSFNEKRTIMTKDQLRAVVKLTNKWLEKHRPGMRIDPKKLGL
jgi:uncharacterized protein